MSAGAASTAAGKSLFCADTPGAYKCLVVGINTNTIGPGVISVASLTLAPTVVSTTINVTGSLGASLNGDAIPVTASGNIVTVQQPVTVSAVSCSPASLGPASTATCSLNLSGPTPAGGINVALSSDNGALTVPPTLSISSGSSAVFSATTGALTADGTANVTASYSGSSAKASLSLVAPLTISSLVCTPASLGSNASSTCTVSLSKTVPAGGVSVVLSSDNNALTVPPTLSISSGSTAIFSATTGPPTADGTANVTASYNGSSAKATISLVAPLTISSLVCTPASLGSNASSTCTVSLSKTVPAGGVSVVLSSDNGALAIPATINVSSGATAVVNATTGALAADGTANVTASYSGSSAIASLSLVAPLTISSLVCTPASLGSNASSTCTVSLSKSVPAGGISVTVSSDNAALLVPSAVSIGSGLKAATFNAVTQILRADGNAMVTARYNGTSASTSVSLTAPVTLSGLACDYTKLAVGASANCTVLLSKASGNITVPLSGSTNISYPSSVTVTAGSSAETFNVTVQKFAKGSGALTAAYEGTTKSVIFDISPSSTLSSLTCTPQTAPAGATVNCAVTIASNLKDSSFVQVRSSNPALQVPPLLVAQPKQVNLPFQCYVANSAAGGPATITATAGLNTVQQALTLVPAATPLLVVPGTQSAQFGRAVQFTVSAIDAEHQPIAITDSGRPDGAVFDSQSGLFQWAPQASQEGRHTVRFTAINSAGISSTAAVSITVDDGKPAIQRLANAASRSSALICAPGALATIQGRWLASASADNPTGRTITLGGATVKINGESVPIVHASPTEVEFLCPMTAAGGMLSISLENESGRTSPVTTVMSSAAPGIFSLDGSGQGQGMIALTGSSDIAIGRNPRVAGRPAQAGELISIYMTGLPPDARLIAMLGGAAAAPIAILPVPDHAGVWEVQVLVPADMPSGNHVSIGVQLVQPDGSRLQSNQVVFAVERI